MSEVGEREVVLVDRVKCGKEWDMTRGWQLLQDTSCAILSLPARELRVFAWWNVIMLCNSARAVLVGVLFYTPVGWLDVFLQPTETGPNSEKNSQIVRPWRMLRIPTARVPPRLFVEHPACFRVNRVVEFFNFFELLFFSLSYLLTARDGSEVLLSPCQVLVVQSFAFSFRLGKVGSGIEWRRGCSARNLLVSAKISIFFHICNKLSRFPSKYCTQDIAVWTNFRTIRRSLCCSCRRSNPAILYWTCWSSASGSSPERRIPCAGGSQTSRSTSWPCSHVLCPAARLQKEGLQKFCNPRCCYKFLRNSSNRG